MQKRVKKFNYSSTDLLLIIVKNCLKIDLFYKIINSCDVNV